MKKKAALTVFLLALAGIAYFSYAVVAELREQAEREQQIAELPEITLHPLEGGTLTAREFAGSGSLILVYFNTECPFCRGEIHSLKMHPELSKKTRIALISDEPLEKLNLFVTREMLDEEQNMQVFHDRSVAVKRIFGVTGVPFTVVYDSSLNLIESLKGEAGSETLYELIQGGSGRK